MFICPKCRKHPLTRIGTDIGVLWGCDRCHGRAVTLSLLRQQIQKNFLNTLWRDIRQAPIARRHGLRPCPSCKNSMVEITIHGISEEIEIDACRNCQFIWFDAHETAQLPVAPPKPASTEAQLSPEAAEALALAKVRLIRDRADKEEARARRWTWWDIALDILNLPIR